MTAHKSLTTEQKREKSDPRKAIKQEGKKNNHEPD